jgi:hypothetical protein
LQTAANSTQGVDHLRSRGRIQFADVAPMRGYDNIGLPVPGAYVARLYDFARFGAEKAPPLMARAKNRFSTNLSAQHHDLFQYKRSHLAGFLQVLCELLVKRVDVVWRGKNNRVFKFNLVELLARPGGDRDQNAAFWVPLTSMSKLGDDHVSCRVGRNRQFSLHWKFPMLKLIKTGKSPSFLRTPEYEMPCG